MLRTQLPDLGPNLKPPSVRRDSWKPFWTVTFPDDDDGYSQGLHAFRKLREWRMLHEFNSTPPRALARPFGQNAIKGLQRRLDDRGGSKTETVYDLIRRRKKSMRTRVVMDQKANSIADLAAVLIGQQHVGDTQRNARTRKGDDQRNVQMAGWLLSLANTADIMIPKMEERLRKFEAVTTRPTDLAKAETGISKGQARRSIPRLERRLKAVRFAVAAISEAKAKYIEDAPGRATAAAKKAAKKAEEAVAGAGDTHAQKIGTIPESDSVRQARETNPEAKNADTRTELSVDDTDVEASHSGTEIVTRVEGKSDLVQGTEPSSHHDLQPYLPSFDSQEIPFEILPKRAGNMGQDLLSQIKKMRKPIYSMKGVKIKWQDPLDAEYAAAWPELVTHEPMGFVQYSAPDPEVQPIMDALDLRESKSVNKAQASRLFRKADYLDSQGDLPGAATLRRMVRFVPRDNKPEDRPVSVEQKLVRILRKQLRREEPFRSAATKKKESLARAAETHAMETHAMETETHAMEITGQETGKEASREIAIPNTKPGVYEWWV